MAKKILPSGDVMYFDECDRELAEKAWYKSAKGYAVHSSGPFKKWFHKEILPCPKGMERDHINGNRLDNRHSNLRIVTSTQNKRNRKGNPCNPAGYKGVRIEQGKYFRAKIQGDWLGYFSTAEEAARAYDKEAKKRYGEYARLNFPE